MKRIIFILLTFVLFVSGGILVNAETLEADLEYIDSAKDIVFCVSWEVETPEVVFISPDGTVLDPNKAVSGTTTVKNEKQLFYIVENAAAGQWRIRYDKKQNPEIDVWVQEYKKGLLIESFTVGPVNGNIINTIFSVSGEENTSYNYKISAIIDHSGREKELLSGTGHVGKEYNVDVNLSRLASYSNYMLKLYVWFNDNGTDYSDFTYSKPFSYHNSSLDNIKGDFQIAVNPELLSLKLSWDNLYWNTENVLVAVFEDDEKEPSFFNEYDANSISSAEFGYGIDAKKVTIEYSVENNGVYSNPIRKEIDLSKFGLAMPQEEARNSIMLPLEYKGYNNQMVNVVVNGYKSELLLNADGSVSITLGDEWNDINVNYVDDNGIVWEILRQVYVDRIAPVLSMTQNYDGMRTEKEKITISGKVDSCEKLLINGTEIKVGKDGGFTSDVSVAEGENKITVVASDALGNESQYSAVVFRGSKALLEHESNASSSDNEGKQVGSLYHKITSPSSYWIMLGVGILCIFVIVYVIIFWRKEDKKDEKK